MTVRVYITLVAALSGMACGQLGSSGPPPPTKIGVFADTGELTELTAYAEQVRMTRDEYGTQSVTDTPAAASVHCFYVNMPNSEITSSKVFLLQQVSWQAAPRPSWSTSPRVFILQQQTETFHENAPELKADIEKAGEGVYKVTVPELSGKKGIVALKVVMPLGTPDRLYLLRLQ